MLTALVPLVFLAVDPAGWYWFGPVKWLLVSTLVPVAATLVTRSPLRLTGRPTIAATALITWIAVAALFAVDPLYAWIGTPERHFGVATWGLCLLALVAGQAFAADDRAVLAVGLVAAGVGLGGVAAAEALGWEPDVFDVGRRLTATFGSAAYLGAATAVLLPCCVGVALDRSMVRVLRIAAVAALPLLGIATIGSGARAAWVGLAASTVVAAVARRDDIGRVVSQRPRRQLLLLAVGVAVASAAVVVWSPIGDRVAATFDRNEPGGSGRVDEWRVATRVMADRPVVGAGPEGYRIVFADGIDRSYEREHGRDPLPDRAHAAPLDIALVGGIPAAGLWALFVVAVGRHVWRALCDQRGLIAGIAAALVAHVVGSLFLFPFAELEPVTWMLAGVVVASTSRASEAREVLAPRLAAPALVVLAVVAATAGALEVAADRRARVAVDAAARGDTATAYAAAEDAAGLRPDSVRLHLLTARTAVADQRGTLTALGHVEDALDRSPRDPVARQERVALLVDRARATLVPAHAAVARAAAEELVRDDPHSAALRMLAGHAARLDGDADAAARQWQTAEDLAPRDPAPPVALALLAFEQGDHETARAALDRAAARDPADPQVLDARRHIDGR